MSETSSSDEDIHWAEEGEAAPAAPCQPWRVLVVDDDEQMHRVTRLNLRELRFRGRPVELIGAYSGAQARALLDSESDLALAIVDVVMETEQSGLDFVRHVRTVACNRAIRLLLRTGQPGHAPEQSVIVDYEIDGYAAKTELTAIKLISCVIAALRTYEYLTALHALNAELEARVAARTSEFERLAMLDTLTGAANRRHFDARYAAEQAALAREFGVLGLLSFDIDHFKQVNDNWGHAGGDAVLCAVVAAVQQALRPRDFLARVGGEEFIVLLPATALAETAAAAERLRCAVAALAVAHGGQTIRVSASFGVHSLRPGADAAQALEDVDAALYEAKRAGRNRVVCAQPL